MKKLLTGVKVTKSQGFGDFNIAYHCQRKSQSRKADEPWYILTNLGSLKETLTAYKARSGIEAMFKDCQTGGYNLEGSRASVERLTPLVLLIAIADTTSARQGLRIKQLTQQKYMARLQELQRQSQRHSNLGIGHYGFLGVASMEFWCTLASEFMRNQP